MSAGGLRMEEGGGLSGLGIGKSNPFRLGRPPAASVYFRFQFYFPDPGIDLDLICI